MIRPCVCIKSSSSLKNSKTKKRKNSRFCKSCGGKLLVDGQDPQQESMLSNGGLELSRLIDPQLTWKNVNGGQRAVRKARTLYVRRNKNEDSKSTEDMPISESEKVGVSILGRRFGDCLGSIPLKKRRFLLQQSSSSHNSSSYSDESDHAMLMEKQNSFNMNFVTVSEGVNTKIFDAADFSGISILAAAACDSCVGLASLEVQGALRENAKLNLSPHEKDVPLSQTSEDFSGRTDLPFDASYSSALHSERSNEVKSDASVKSIQLIPSKTMEVTSYDVRFPWDLNAAIDESREEVLNSENEVTYNGSQNANHDEKSRNSEQVMDQMELGDDKSVPTDSKLVDSSEKLGNGTKTVNCASSFEAKVKLVIASGHPIEDSIESRPFSTLCTDTLVEEKHLEDVKSNIDAKPLIDKNKSYSVLRPVKDVSLFSETDMEVGKIVTCDVPFHLKVETENTSSYLVSCDSGVPESHCGMNNELVKAEGSLAGKHESLSVESSCHLEHKEPAVLVTGSTCENITECMNSDGLNETHHDDAKSKEKDASEIETASIETDIDTTVNDMDSNNISTSICADTTDCKNSIDFASNPFQVVLDNHVECNNNSDTSQNNGDDQADGMEKVDFLADDDSQYEDGEFREPLANYWLDDAAEEGETENVDPGSDGDTDAYKTTLDISSVYPHMNNVVGPPNAVSMTRKDTSESNDGAKKLSHPNDYRKMSGWDRLPGACTNSLNRVSQNRNEYICDTVDRERSSLCRDFSSRTDMSQRNDKFYVRPSRSGDHNGFNSRVERHRDDPRPIGRRGPSIHSQDRDRGDYWAEFSPKYHSNSRHDTSNYYGSRNAAAAAVAKVESNGFVVAPDGTIVKASGARSMKVSSYQDAHRSSMGRGSPIERERKYGMGLDRSRETSPERSKFVGRGNACRYGHGMKGVDSSSMHYSARRRESAFSPVRRNFQLSRSPSRSRTRSPYRLTSPRDRNDVIRSRSPNFGPETRMDRPRRGYGEHLISYDSLSRKHASPTHVSKWTDGRKEVDHIRDHRFEPQGNNCDSMDARGRVEQDEYSRLTNCGRFHEVARKSDNRREQHYRNDGYIRRLWYDDENSLFAQNMRRSTDFQRREFPRGFNREINERRRRDSPRRPNEERDHFGNSKGGSHNANFKSFGIRNGDYKLDAQRRPL